MSSTTSAALAQLRYELLCAKLEIQRTTIDNLERRMRDLEDKLKPPALHGGFTGGFNFDPNPRPESRLDPFSFKPTPAPVFGFPLGSHSFGSLASTEPATTAPIPTPQGFNACFAPQSSSSSS